MQKTAIFTALMLICFIPFLLSLPVEAEPLMIYNGDFEILNTSGLPEAKTGRWIPNEYTHMISVSDAVYRGERGHSMCLAGAETTDTPYIKADVSVEQLHIYTVTMHVNVESFAGKRGMGFSIYFFDDAQKDNYDTAVRKTLSAHRVEERGKWVEVSENFTVPAGFVRARIMFGLRSGGKVYIDDVSCRLSAEPVYLTLEREKVFNYTEDGSGKITAKLNTVTYPEIAGSAVTFSLAGTSEGAVVFPNADGIAEFTYSLSEMELKTPYTLTVSVAGHSYSTKVYRYNRPTDLNVPIKNRVYAYHAADYLLVKYEELTTDDFIADFTALKESGIGILQVTSASLEKKLVAAKAAGVKLLVNLYTNMYPAGHEKNIQTTTKLIEKVTKNNLGANGVAIDFSEYIFAWQIMDEPFANDPGCFETLLDSYVLIRSMDDRHPVWVMEDGNNYKLSAKCCDIMGMDIYPGSQTGENIRPYYTDIAARLQRATEESGGIVPLWPLYQTFYYRTWFPDITALRSMIYQGFLGGAEAIGYYELDNAYPGKPLMETDLWEGITAWHAEEEGIALRHFTEKGATRTLGRKDTDTYTAEHWQDDTYVYALFVNKTNAPAPAAIENAGTTLYVEKTFGGTASVINANVVCTIPAGGAVLVRLSDSGDRFLLLKEGRWETAVSAGTWEVRGTFGEETAVYVGLYKNNELVSFYPLGVQTGTFSESFTVPAGNYQGAALKCFAWRSGIIPARPAQVVGTK